MRNSALHDWSNFVFSLAMKDPQYTVGIRKIVPDIAFTTELDKSIQLFNVGFKEGGTKIAMLTRYYYNQESIDKAKAALTVMTKKKKCGSVAFSTIGHEKTFTHHQHCIQTVSIRRHLSGELEYTVFYRAAEVVKIFTGDMVFIRDVLMPIFGGGKICFFFSNATFNSMYSPLLFIHDYKKWYEGMEKINKVDPDFVRRCHTWAKRYFSDNEINYRSAEAVRLHCHEHLSKRKRDAVLDLYKGLS